MDRSIGQIAYEQFINSPSSWNQPTPPVPYSGLTADLKWAWEETARAVITSVFGSVSKVSGWVGVDFDGTLATYDPTSHGELGPPIAPVRDHVLRLFAEGTPVKIVTARVAPCPDIFGRFVHPAKERAKIEAWCIKHLGRKLDITSCKDYGMIELIDDRAVQVVPNRGIRVDNKPW